MAEVQAELKRRDQSDNLVNWKIITDADQTVTNLSDPVIDSGVRTRLDSIKTKLDTIEASLDADIGLIGDTESTSGDGSVIALLKNLRTRISNIESAANAINLNTDGAETLLTAIRDAVDMLELQTDGLEPALGAITDAEVATGDGSIIAILKNHRTRLSNLETKLQTLLEQTDAVEVKLADLLTELSLKTEPLNTQIVKDDYDSFEAQHVTLVANTDTTITFAQTVRSVRVTNWDTGNRVLVKDGAITTNTDATAGRVGKAPASDVPNSDWFPIATDTIHLRSASTNEVTVEGYFGNA